MCGSEYTPYIFYFKFKVAVSKLLFILYCAKSTLKNDKKHIFKVETGGNVLTFSSMVYVDIFKF